MSILKTAKITQSTRSSNTSRVSLIPLDDLQNVPELNSILQVNINLGSNLNKFSIIQRILPDLISVKYAIFHFFSVQWWQSIVTVQTKAGAKLLWIAFLIQVKLQLQHDFWL